MLPGAQPALFGLGPDKLSSECCRIDQLSEFQISLRSVSTERGEMEPSTL